MGIWGADTEPVGSLCAMQFRAPARQLCQDGRFHLSVVVSLPVLQIYTFATRLPMLQTGLGRSLIEKEMLEPTDLVLLTRGYLLCEPAAGSSENCLTLA